MKTVETETGCSAPEWAEQLCSLQEALQAATSATPCSVVSSVTTGNTLCRGFDTTSFTSLNTPEVTNTNTFEESFEDFFTSSSTDCGKPASENMDYNTTEHMEPVYSQPEQIWGYKTFDDQVDDFEMICAPATLVEGSIVNVEMDDELKNAETVVVVENAEPEEEKLEQSDLLQWVINDQEIGDLPLLLGESCPSQPEQTPVIHSVAVTLPPSTSPASLVLQQEQLVKVEEVKVKTENMTEEEKYRKMRLQNNLASQKCRQNRKRKAGEQELECAALLTRNAELKQRLALLEQEVAMWKQRLLTDISLKAKPF